MDHHSDPHGQAINVMKVGTTSS
jgi:hypothetical protein